MTISGHSASYDFEQDLDIGQPVHTGGVDERLWDGEKKLAEQQNAESADHARNDERQISVGPMQFDHENIQRNQSELKRDHHGEQDGVEHEAAAAEFQPGQGIAAHGAEKQHRGGDDHRDKNAVEQRPEDGDFGQHLAIAVQSES